MSWWRRLGARARWDGSSGQPRSANGASSLHLRWEAPRGEWVGAEAVVEVVEPPQVPALYFWALQVSFTDRGRSGGGAHLGLQWYPPHPGSTAVNWGGYAPTGGELTGLPSSLPSATDNLNTRDFAWRPGTPYRLRVLRAEGAASAWRGEVVDLATGVTTHVRDLFAPGTTALDAPLVWSEVFADCDAPSVTVRWSDLALIDTSGARHAIDRVTTSYQSVGDGGCRSTNSTVHDGGFEQSTNTPRTNPPGTHLVLP